VEKPNLLSSSIYVGHPASTEGAARVSSLTYAKNIVNALKNSINVVSVLKNNINVVNGLKNNIFTVVSQ